MSSAPIRHLLPSIQSFDLGFGYCPRSSACRFRLSVLFPYLSSSGPAAAVLVWQSQHILIHRYCAVRQSPRASFFEPLQDFHFQISWTLSHSLDLSWILQRLFEL
jgi:hypothetical protein